MAHVLIVYTSLFENTRKLAEAVAEGARSVPDTDVAMKSAEEATQEDARTCDALVLGSPVHMGMLDWRLKRFIDNAVYHLWLTDDLVGKVGAAFTTGGGYGDAGSGSELTQLAMLGPLAECGMVLVPFPKSSPGSETTGSRWGPHARTGGRRMEPVGIQDEALEGGRQHGASVARVAAALAGRGLLPRSNQVPEGDVLKAFQGVSG